MHIFEINKRKYNYRVSSERNVVRVAFILIVTVGNKVLDFHCVIYFVIGFIAHKFQCDLFKFQNYKFNVQSFGQELNVHYVLIETMSSYQNLHAVDFIQLTIP